LHWSLNSGPIPWATLPVLSCDCFFEIVSCELFAWAGFQLWSSWSLSPE
jgi:hypothetical protein